MTTLKQLRAIDNPELKYALQELDANAVPSGIKIDIALKKCREICKTDLFFLVRHVLGYKDLNETFHRPLCNTLTKYKENEQLHLHPRGHFKSTVITIGETIQDVIINPNIRILIVNAVLGKAKAFLREIVSHFEKNEFFLDMFPEHRVSKISEKGTQEQFTTQARDAYWIRESTVEVTGIDKAVVSAHYDKIVFDDVVNGLNVTTKEQRQKTLNSYREYLSLLDPPGIVRIVGTRWHHDDLYGTLVSQIKSGQSLSGEEEQETEDTVIFRTSAYTGNGEPSFPERFSLKYLRKLERKQGKRIFSCQYRNQPIANEDKIFDIKNLRYCKSPFVGSGEYFTCFTTIDPAVSEKEIDDPTVIMTILCNADGDIFITRIDRGWWNPDQIIDRCISVANADRPNRMGMEVIAFQRTLKYFLEERIAKQNRYFKVEEIRRNTQVHKVTRISRVQPYLAENKIWLVGDPNNLTEEQKAFVTELDEFPYSSHDDTLDTLADAIELMRLPGKKRKCKIEYSRVRSDSPYRTARGYRKLIRKISE